MDTNNFSNALEQDPPEKTTATLGLVTATKGSVQKRFTLGDDGKLIKDPNHYLAVSSGWFNDIQVSGLEGLKDGLVGLKPNEAITLGISGKLPVGGLQGLALTTAEKWAENGKKEGTIARTKECITWPRGNFFLLLDHDSEPGSPPVSPDELWARLIACVPELEGVGRLVTHSTSSFIYDSATGECLKGAGNHHTDIECFGDVNRFLVLLKVRLWAGEEGFFKLASPNTQTGVSAVLERFLLDLSVFSPERLVYEAGADLGPGLEQRRPEPTLYPGRVLDLDSLPAPTEAEIAAAAANRAAAEGSERLEQFNRATDFQSKEKNLEPEAAKKAAKKAIRSCDCGFLSPNHILYLADGSEIAAGELTKDHVGLKLRDPQEPDYDGGRVVAQIFRKKKEICIHSFAHGGKNYIIDSKNSEKVVEDKPSTADRDKPSTADRLISLFHGDPENQIFHTSELWHTAGGEAYADIYDEGVRYTYDLRKADFKSWLLRAFYRHTKKSAGSEAVQQAINTLEAIAVHDGPEREAHLRIAEYEGKIYIDLADETWRAVEISAEGWQIAREAPVRFRRVKTLLPLPEPACGGTIEDLRQFLNLSSSDWVLVSSWLLNCFKPAATYPVLILHGEAGAGKSTFTELLKRLVDPGKGGLLPGVGDLRNLSITANNRHLVAFDNLSGLSAEQSDCLCRIATGGGFTSRTLYSNSDETVLEFVRPQIINGIESIATRGDLLSRAVLVQVPSPKIRLSASELWANFDRQHPRFFGAILDALSSALRNLPHTNPIELPRMADFAKFAIAAETGLGLEPGDFMDAYNQSRAQAHDTALEASPVGQAIISLMATRTEWCGTVQELLEALRQRVDESVQRSKYFPIDATRLSKLLTRLAPDLRGVGVDCQRRKSKGIKFLELTRRLEDEFSRVASRASGNSSDPPETPSDPASDPTPKPSSECVTGAATPARVARVARSDVLPSSPQSSSEVDLDDDWGEPTEKAARKWIPKVGDQVRKNSWLGTVESVKDNITYVRWTGGAYPKGEDPSDLKLA